MTRDRGIFLGDPIFSGLFERNKPYPACVRAATNFNLNDVIIHYSFPPMKPFIVCHLLVEKMQQKSKKLGGVGGSGCNSLVKKVKDLGQFHTAF
jgi:hypothetical protein